MLIYVLVSIFSIDGVVDGRLRAFQRCGDLCNRQDFIVDWHTSPSLLRPFLPSAVSGAASTDTFRLYVEIIVRQLQLFHGLFNESLEMLLRVFPLRIGHSDHEQATYGHFCSFLPYNRQLLDLLSLRINSTRSH